MFCLELYMPLFHHGVYGTNVCSSDVYSELEVRLGSLIACLTVLELF